MVFWIACYLWIGALYATWRTGSKHLDLPRIAQWESREFGLPLAGAWTCIIIGIGVVVCFWPVFAARYLYARRWMR